MHKRLQFRKGQWVHFYIEGDTVTVRVKSHNRRLTPIFIAAHYRSGCGRGHWGMVDDVASFACYYADNPKEADGITLIAPGWWDRYGDEVQAAIPWRTESGDIAFGK